MTTPQTDTKNDELPADIAALGFEDAYEALEEAIEKLETGELSLGDSLTLHERGVALSRRCDQLLTAAELRVKKIDEEGRDAGELDL